MAKFLIPDIEKMGRGQVFGKYTKVHCELADKAWHIVALWGDRLINRLLTFGHFHGSEPSKSRNLKITGELQRCGR